MGPKAWCIYCPLSLCKSVRSIQNLRTGGGWFNLQLSQDSFQGLMMTGFIPLLPRSIVTTMVK